MRTAALIVVELALALLAGVLWIVAGTRTGRMVLLLAGTALLISVARLAAVVLLLGRGWWFAGEKVIVGVPLAVVGLAAAWALLMRDVLHAHSGPAMPSPATRTALFGCGYAHLAGVLLVVVIGYPVGVVGASVIVLLVGAASAVTFLVLTGRPARVVATVSGIAVVLVTGAVARAWVADLSASPAFGAGHHAHGEGKGAPQGGISVGDLRGPDGPADVRVELVARQQSLTLPSGRTVEAWTFGSVPGPTITATVGDLVEIVLRNADVDAGVTLHWHGYEVPNAEDGVAGVTQDAVPPGGSHIYRFVADRAGTFWYHTHQHSFEGVRRGLWGTFLVLPRGGPAEDIDLSLPFGIVGGTTVLAGSDVLERRVVPAGSTVRLRLVNTDEVPRLFGVSGAAFVVAAMDGRDLPGGALVRDRALRVPAGGRVDVTLTLPDGAVRVSVLGGGDAGMLLAPDVSMPDPGDAIPDTVFDPLGYGTRSDAVDLADPFDVEATLVLDRCPRFLDGVPTYGYTVNGEVFPHIPPTVVDEGDRVLLRVVNRGFETHPMHPHGHRVLVRSVDGVRLSGAPLWLDTFDVQPGEVWEVVLVADNPGIWMDHCHNLEHAAGGMVTTLAYRGVQTPFGHGGAAGNDPE